MQIAINDTERIKEVFPIIIQRI